MADSLKKKTLHGLAWSGIENFAPQVMSFIVMLVVARILSPRDYGLVGMLSIFIGVSNSIINSGFSQALIRKQDRTETDCSTVFYFNIVVSIILYLILYFIAPYVATFYKEPQLCQIMRVSCIGLIINSAAVVQRALYTASVNFKTQAKATLSTSVFSGIICITLALLGFGVWTIVLQTLLGSLLNVFLLWWLSSWRPKLVYSWKSFHELFSFGSKLMISGLIDTLYRNMYLLVIGKVFSASSLGHYSRAKHYQALFSSNLTGILQRVTYPVLCKMQDNDEQLRINYRKLLRVSAFVIFPIMCGLAGVSYPLIEVMIGKKWHFAATLLIPLCLAGMWYPIHAINLNLLQVKGRSDLFLRLEIIKKVIGVVVLIFSIPFGLFWMCWIGIITSIICLIINTYYTGKLIKVGFFMQMRDLLPSLLLSLCVFGVCFIECRFIGNNWLKLLAAIPSGIIIYYLGSTLMKFPEISYLKSLRK